eukprot:6011337-Pleurochrysis_carterae.AAC.1
MSGLLGVGVGLGRVRVHVCVCIVQTPNVYGASLRDPSSCWPAHLLFLIWTTWQFLSQHTAPTRFFQWQLESAELAGTVFEFEVHTVHGMEMLAPSPS